MRPRVRLAEESRCMKQIENFSPRGMEVLVVDDDPLCLMVLERMLQQCDYNVTTCSRVSEAISMVRERKDRFDLVMSDVYMPNEDGFKLLEFIGLTLDLPVIMMSANGETSMVMKGITHGACDYLVKPVRMEELRNIWQHVVRRRGREYLREESGDSENETSKLVESSESSSKKRKDSQNLDHSSEIIDDISSLKKTRIHWTVQLHQQFVAAVNQLGIDKAVPKRIIEIMGVHGLTRENVASHLQKYRLYLKRLSGSIPAPYPVASFQAAEGGKSGGRMHIQPPAKSGASSPVLTKGLNLGFATSPNSTGSFGIGGIDQGTLKSLEQYRAYEQKRAANRAQVLGGIGIMPSKQSSVGQLPAESKGGLQRMASVDLSLLWKAQRDQASNQKPAGLNIGDDLADQSIKKAVKLENVQLEPFTVQPTSKHSRAHSMSNVLTDFCNIDPPLTGFQRSGMLKEINELQPMEGISWEGSTSAKGEFRPVEEMSWKGSTSNGGAGAEVGVDTSVDLFDDFVEEYGITSLSPPPTEMDEQSFVGADFEGMGEAGNQDPSPISPDDIADYLFDDFLPRSR